MAFTYFFRDRQTLDLIAEHVLPGLTGRRYIDIWDAGCAHGPEPFSLAMQLRENMTHFLFRNVRIWATDIDEGGDFGATIRRGVYPATEVARIPAEIRRRYFRGGLADGALEIDEEIRGCLRFLRHDLLTLRPPRTGFSLIVCKNVLLHFNESERAAVVRMFHAALCEDGHLVTEATQRLPSAVEHLFEPLTTQGRVLRRQSVTERRRGVDRIGCQDDEAWLSNNANSGHG